MHSMRGFGKMYGNRLIVEFSMDNSNVGVEGGDWLFVGRCRE